MRGRRHPAWGPNSETKDENGMQTCKVIGLTGLHVNRKLIYFYGFATGSWSSLKNAVVHLKNMSS